ncbi:MAG: diacylglycerol kinase [Thermoleophilia bacterium]
MSGRHGEGRQAGREQASQPESQHPRQIADENRPLSFGQASILRSFNYAFDGLVYVFRYQRNMRIHFGLALLVLGAALFFRLSRLELLAVFAAIAFVFIAEMLNTALEAAIDLFTRSYDPRARIAKDVAAGAVLVAAVNALVVAYFVFSDKAAGVADNVFSRLRGSPSHLTFVTLLILILLVIILKARSGRGRAFSGGMPSGHAAVAFGSWAAVSFILVGSPHLFLVSALTFFMALLTAQTRVESGVHTVREVVLGALLGTALVTLVFQLVY